MNIKENLVAMGAEKLADFLIEFSASNKMIKKQLNTAIAGQNKDPKKLLSIINRELSTLKKAKGMIFYDGVKAFAQRLDQLRISIVKELAGKSVQTAVHAMGVFLDLSKLSGFPELVIYPYPPQIKKTVATNPPKVVKIETIL